MHIHYSDNVIKKLCENHDRAVRRFSQRDADKLTQRLQELESADNLGVFKKIYPLAKCHPLVGSKLGQWAVSLHSLNRLTFVPICEEGISINESQEIMLITIENYH